MPWLSPTGRGWNFLIIPIKEQVRVMKWIPPLQQGSPGLAHMAPLAISPLLLSRIVTVQSTGRALQVKQFRKRCPDNPVTMVYKFQAKINVVEDNRQIDLIQPADLKEYRTPDCDAGAGHGQKCPRQRQLTTIAGIILAGKTVQVDYMPLWS